MLDITEDMARKDIVEAVKDAREKDDSFDDVDLRGSKEEILEDIQKVLDKKVEDAHASELASSEEGTDNPLEVVSEVSDKTPKVESAGDMIEQLADESVSEPESEDKEEDTEESKVTFYRRHQVQTTAGGRIAKR